MKVLCEYTPCGPSFVRTGWGRVFAALGHEFQFWAPDREPAFDAFRRVEPDLFLGTTYGVDRAVYKNIALRPEMKVALFASAWGDLVDGIDREKYPIVLASEQERAVIGKLKAETGRPDFVFIHVTDEYLEGVVGGWRTIGVEPVGVLNACDTFAFLGAEYRPELACDVGFVGGYWGYKARNIDTHVLPLCHPSSLLSVKIFGNQPWPVAQYLGPCTEAQNRDLTVSATVCPNVSEPHSTASELGFDTIERPFRVLGAGGFCVSDRVEEMKHVFDNDLIRARDAKDFRETVRHFVAHPDERGPWVEKGRARVLRAHTYFDRVAKMMVSLGLPDESDRAIKLKLDVLDKAGFDPSGYRKVS